MFSFEIYIQNCFVVQYIITFLTQYFNFNEQITLCDNLRIHPKFGTHLEQVYLERKIIEKYAESIVVGKERDEILQYFLRLAKYFKKEFQTNFQLHSDTREFIELANRFANYQKQIENTNGSYQHNC